MYSPRFDKPSIRYNVQLKNTVPIQTSKDLNIEDGAIPAKAGYRNALSTLNSFLDKYNKTLKDYGLLLS